MTMLELIPYQTYSRKDVHDIFSPETPFTLQAGTWGLHGIVSIPGRPGDFVFFVTFGQQQGDHVFDEGVTADGVLSWQSQPRQSLENDQIQQLINYDELVNTIYLFLRTQPRQDYRYLGRLKYLSHDKQRERPVYFQWQILDWDPPADILHELAGHQSQLPINALREVRPLSEKPPQRDAPLQETPVPQPRQTKGVATPQFRTIKAGDHGLQDERNRKLGLAGEHAVIAYEQRMLREQGRDDLAAKIRHVSQVEGDGAGYDILSFAADGQEKYIEVKTTKGGAYSSFYLSRNEVEFAKRHIGNFYIYRVYNFVSERSPGQFFILAGELESQLTLEPTQYRVNLGPRD